MLGLGRKFTTIAVALSLCAVPTGAIAWSPAPISAAPAATAAPATAAVPSDQWLALSAMTTGSAATSAAALQRDERPGLPPAAPLIVILGTIALAIYILLKDDDGELDFAPEPGSPD